MELFLDTAHAASIRVLSAALSIDGVTTNPAILVKEGQDWQQSLAEVMAVLQPQQKLFVEVVREDYQGMVAEARYLSGLRDNLYVKIPCTYDGLRAIKTLHQEGVKILATAVFSATQGLMAAKNGAEYLAPYVNRMDNYGDGVQETITMQNLLSASLMPAKIIAASFKNVHQVAALLEAGIEAVTVPPEVCEKMFLHPGTEQAVQQFRELWRKAYQKDSL